MVDIRREARRYANSHPYEAVRIRQPKSQQNVWRYRLRITDQPDPMISAVLGDFVHNLRSALDHVIVASSKPRSARANAGFPISTDDLWARDAKRRYIVRDSERRKSFNRSIAGLHPQAQTLVKGVQPYRRPSQAGQNILAIISRLENADKHRELIAVGSGLENRVTTTITARGEVEEYIVPLGRNQFLKDGTEVLHATWIRSPPLQESEVDVQCRGTAAITIKVTDIGGNRPPSDYRLYKTMRYALRDVRYLLLMLEPFVQRP